MIIITNTLGFISLRNMALIFAGFERLASLFCYDRDGDEFGVNPSTHDHDL